MILKMLKKLISLVRMCLSANYGYKNKLFENLEDYEKTRK